MEKLKHDSFQVVILDVMLPGIDGFEVLRQIRRISVVPVLMLTALGDEADRIVGLEIGADDYLPKTFSTRELLARLRAVTRRSQIAATQLKADDIKVGDICINLPTREVLQNGEKLNLTALEFDLLQYLARSAGRILTRDQLLDEIAGRNYDVFDRSVDVHVSSLTGKGSFFDPTPWLVIIGLITIVSMLAAERFPRKTDCRTVSPLLFCSRLRIKNRKEKSTDFSIDFSFFDWFTPFRSAKFFP